MDVRDCCTLNDMQQAERMETVSRDLFNSCRLHEFFLVGLPTYFRRCLFFLRFFQSYLDSHSYRSVAGSHNHVQLCRNPGGSVSAPLVDDPWKRGVGHNYWMRIACWFFNRRVFWTYVRVWTSLALSVSIHNYPGRTFWCPKEIDQATYGNIFFHWPMFFSSSAVVTFHCGSFRVPCRALRSRLGIMN